MPREKILNPQDPKYQIPPKFEFKGKLIIITNLLKKQIDRALFSRAPVVEIKFNTEEIIKHIEKMMTCISPSVSMETKMEVFNYILSLYKQNKHINFNFRSFQNAIDARIGIPDHWKEMIKNIVEFEQ